MKIYQSDSIFKEEIFKFSKVLNIKPISKTSIKQIWKIIQPCISGYLIKHCYSKLNNNRLTQINSFNEKARITSAIENFDEDEFIELREIGRTTSSIVFLIYHIEREELFVLKKFFTNNNEYSKLRNRENSNYSKLCHPFLSKFYGVIKNKNYSIIEYINGQTLLEIEQLHLSMNDKITIIFELILIFLYLHKYNFIYRDLKPNNIMIDKNKNAVLIDFDRMISLSKDDDEMHTQDFSSIFVAPEVNFGEPSYKSDIYSLGQMIHYIMKMMMK